MKAKTNKGKDQIETAGTSIRVRQATKSAALAKLKEINQKQLGRKIKPDELLCFAINRLTDEDVKALQEMSLSNEDRKAKMRQRYVEIHGPISEDEFTGFTFTPEFQTFLADNFSPTRRHNSAKECAALAS
jgi:hypothetical protein